MNQDGIEFTNVKVAGEITGGAPISTGNNGIDEFGGIINAIEIDWNGAQLADGMYRA